MFIHRAELSLLISILKNFHINTHFIYGDIPDTHKIDMGIRSFLKLDADYTRFFVDASLEGNTVYKITDGFFCCYIFIVLPAATQRTTLVIGPFTNIGISRQMLLQASELYNISPNVFSQLEKYYMDIPVITNESSLFAIINAFGEKIWGSLENFSVKSLSHSFSETEIKDVFDNLTISKDDAELSIKILEKRYAKENELIDAVSKGMVNKAELMMTTVAQTQTEQRVADPIRSFKNYTIILNTILRKAAEKGGVHPLHIDSVSSDFAKKIELINSLEAGSRLQREMAKRYSVLVRDSSVKKYSPPVMKAILYTEHDLTAELSLRHISEKLNINPSYFSALFKKETGQTLTQFITKKRMELAAHLLSENNLQVQTVAQQCGIFDVNYFTKTFKKIYGKTPSEYKNKN